MFIDVITSPGKYFQAYDVFFTAPPDSHGLFVKSYARVNRRKFLKYNGDYLLFIKF